MWKRQMWVAYLFILPATSIISIFVIIPSLVSIYFSFFKYDAITPSKFIGLRNYWEFFFSDPLALRSLSINLYYIIGTLPVAILVGFIIAIALNARWFRGRQFFNAAYFIPVAISMVGGSAICLWLLDPMGGLVNWFMQVIGLSPQAWVGDPKLALLTICLVSIWKNLGFFMVIYLTALQAIPSTYYEAARIDGANRWQEIYHITWPIVIPTTFFLLIMGTIGGFQIFDQIYVMTQGGPANATKVIVFYIYETGFGGQVRMGYSSAIAVVLMVIALVITGLQWKYYLRVAE